MLNSFVGLNKNIQEEFSTPLNLTISIIKKSAQELQELKVYESNVKPLVIGKEVFKPDFYLKDKDVYLEHWGYDESNKEYTKRKEYKLPKYKEKGITLIQTNEKDMQDVETSLELKLTNYIIGEINEE